MSKPSRRENRRDRHGRGLPRDTTVCVQSAMTETGDRDEISGAQRITHDRLIEALGPRRRGGVHWRVVEPADVLDAIGELSGPESLGHERPDGRSVDESVALSEFDQMRAWALEHPDGYLVIAYAEAEYRRPKPEPRSVGPA